MVSMVADPNLHRVLDASSKSLNLSSGCREIEPEHLPAIYPICANLTSLNFSYANLIADQLNPVIRQCHNLQTFRVLDTDEMKEFAYIGQFGKLMRTLSGF